MNAWRKQGRMAATVILVAIALYSLASGLLRIDQLQTQIQARLGEQAALAELGEKVIQLRAAHDWMSSTATTNGLLASLARQYLSGSPHDIALRERKDDGGAWSFQRYDLRIERVDATTAGRFLAACENARPPIRLIDIQVSSAATAPGQYTLQLALAEATRKAAVSE